MSTELEKKMASLEKVKKRLLVVMEKLIRAINEAIKSQGEFARTCDMILAEEERRRMEERRNEL